MYVVRVPLQGGGVVRTCDHQSIKEFASIKKKMRITPVIYSRVNIYRQIRLACRTFYTVISQLLSFAVLQCLAINREGNTQNLPF